MKRLEERIRQDGVIGGGVLKVDSFLNHQIDVAFLREIGQEFKRRFAGKPVDKILTVEASGIGVACITAQAFGDIPVVVAKKARSVNLEGDVYTTKIESFTQKRLYDVMVSRKFITPEDHILIIDDFLANGCALEGLIDLVRHAGATLEGVGVVIEKGFQQGGSMIRARGIELQSLAIIDRLDACTGEILFRRQEV